MTNTLGITLEIINNYISALLYTYKNKIVYDEILLSWSVVYCVSALAGPYAYVRTASQPIRSKNSFRISISIQ